MTPEVQDLVRRLDQCRRLPRGEQVVFEREFIDQLHAALETLSAECRVHSINAVAARAAAAQAIGERDAAMADAASRAAPTDEEVETAAREAYRELARGKGWVRWTELAETSQAYWRRTVTRFTARRPDDNRETGT